MRFDINWDFFKKLFKSYLFVGIHTYSMHDSFIKMHSHTQKLHYELRKETSETAI